MNAHIATNLTPYCEMLSKDLVGTSPAPSWAFRKLSGTENERVKQAIEVENKVRSIKTIVDSLSSSSSSHKVDESAVDGLARDIACVDQLVDQFYEFRALSTALKNLGQALRAHLNVLLKPLMAEKQGSIATSVGEQLCNITDAGYKVDPAVVDGVGKEVDSFCRLMASSDQIPDKQEHIAAALLVKECMQAWSLCTSNDGGVDGLSEQFMECTTSLSKMIGWHEVLSKGSLEGAPMDQRNKGLRLVAQYFGSNNGKSAVAFGGIIDRLFAIYMESRQNAVKKADQLCDAVLKELSLTALPVWHDDANCIEHADQSFMSLVAAIDLKKLSTRIATTKQACENAAKATHQRPDAISGYVRLVARHKEVLGVMTQNTILKVLQSQAKADVKRKQLGSCMHIAQLEGLSIAANVQARVTEHGFDLQHVSKA